MNLLITQQNLSFLSDICIYIMNFFLLRSIVPRGEHEKEKEKEEREWFEILKKENIERDRTVRLSNIFSVSLLNILPNMSLTNRLLPNNSSRLLNCPTFYFDQNLIMF